MQTARAPAFEKLRRPRILALEGHQRAGINEITWLETARMPYPSVKLAPYSQNQHSICTLAVRWSFHKNLFFALQNHFFGIYEDIYE